MLNKLRDEIHENAQAHGWWDEERSHGEIIALCHSELSEALEEYRNKKPLLYYSGGGYEVDQPTECCKKPEGIAAELADVIIRVLDYFGYCKWDMDRAIKFRFDIDIKHKDFGEFISLCHDYLSRAFEYSTTSDYWFGGLVNLINNYCSDNQIDIKEAIHIKHEYNKTRPYRHGGKVI